MKYVIISIGSNCHQTTHLQWASQRMASMLSDIRFSRKLWTPDIHGKGSFYLNQLVAGTTELSVNVLQQLLKDMEKETERKPGSVTIDMDLMLYDGQRYHEKDWLRPYIQQLISDII